MFADPGRVAELGVPLSCPSKPDSGVQNTCVDAGGSCVKFVDGFYPLSLGVSVAQSLVILATGVLLPKAVSGQVLLMTWPFASRFCKGLRSLELCPLKNQTGFSGMWCIVLNACFDLFLCS